MTATIHSIATVHGWFAGYDLIFSIVELAMMKLWLYAIQK